MEFMLAVSVAGLSIIQKFKKKMGFIEGVCGPLMVAQWLRYCATNRRVAGSIPDGVIGIFSLT
jgi:hypothetical protein